MEADDHWVREQIRKGVGVGPPASSSHPNTAAAYAAASRPAYGSAGAASRPVAGTRAAAESLATSGASALKTLQSSLHRLKARPPQE